MLSPADLRFAPRLMNYHPSLVARYTLIQSAWEGDSAGHCNGEGEAAAATTALEDDQPHTAPRKRRKGAVLAREQQYGIYTEMDGLKKLSFLFGIISDRFKISI